MTSAPLYRPIEADLPKPTPLDVDISFEYSDLFQRRYWLRTNDFFLVERTGLKTELKQQPQMLGYGLLRRITRALILKFGQLSLLL